MVSPSGEPEPVAARSREPPGGTAPEPPPRRSAIGYPARLRPDRFTLLLAAAAVLGAAHILVRTSTHGAGILSDSMNYISMAESLAAGDGLRNPEGGWSAYFPPFYSMVMAFFRWLGMAPADSGRLVNAASFGLIVLVSGRWLRRRLDSRLLVLAAVVSVMTSHALNSVASFLVSESLFILLSLLALTRLESFLNRRSGRSALALSVVFAALAALTRYMGVTVICAGTLAILMRRGTPAYARLKLAAAYGAIASIPLAVFLARNWAVRGTLTGRRDFLATGQSLSDSLGQISTVLGKGVLLGFPAAVSDDLRNLLGAAAGLAVLGAAAIFIALHAKAAAKRPFGVRPDLPFGLFALVYLVTLLAAVPLTVSQGIGHRYLAPAYAPLVFVAAIAVDGFLRREAPEGGRPIRWSLVGRTLGLLVLSGWLAHVGLTARGGLQLTARALESGYIGDSFNTAYWDDSEMLEHVRARHAGDRIYTNSPNPFRWRAGVPAHRVKWVAMRRDPATGVRSCSSWLRKALSRSRRQSSGPERGKGQERQGETYIAWLNKGGSGRGEGNAKRCRFLLERRLPSLELAADLADGVMFRVNQAAAESAEPYRPVYESIVRGEPVAAARSGFDVYMDGLGLTYVKAPCAPADVEAPFFLEIAPADEGDLPPERRRYGFDRRTFGFYPSSGVMFDGICMVAVPLPGYAIDRIRTGQLIPGEGRSWEAELPGLRTGVPQRSAGSGP